MDAQNFPPSAPEPEVQPTIGARESVAIIIGIVVGAGIFRTPSLVAGASSSESGMLLAWLLGGVISLIGALCYAELASNYPHVGGDYHFLTRAYGRVVGFLYAWSRMTVIQTGSIAVLAYVFGDYATRLLSLGPHSAAIYAAICVVAVTAVNWIGVRAGTQVQSWLTVLELAGLALIVIVGAVVTPAGAAAPSEPQTTNLGLVLVFVLLTYGGWNEAAYVSAELRDGRRRMAPVLALSMLLITMLYLLVNWAYLRVLGLSGVAGSEAVAADVVSRGLGDAGAALISLLIAISALTSANATAFTGARSAFALGHDHPKLRFMGRWRERGATPGNALLVQGAAALLLVAASAFARDSFQAVVEYTAPVFWLFFLLAGISLFILRRRAPPRAPGFRTPLYPVFPLLFCAANAYLLYASLAYTGWSAVAGVVVLAIGGLAFLIFGHHPRGADR